MAPQNTPVGKLGVSLLKWLTPIAGILVFLAIWQAGVMLSKVPTYLLPAPTQIAETFIDECAHAAGVDPLEYRLKILDGYVDPGWTACLKEASSKAGWGKSLPTGLQPCRCRATDRNASSPVERMGARARRTDCP